MNKLRLIQPYIFGLYPFLWAYAANLPQIYPSMLIRPLILLVIFVTIILLFFIFIFKSRDKAAVIASLFIVMVFDYGYYQSFPKEFRLLGIFINRHLVIIPIWAIIFAALSSHIIWKRVRPNIVSSYMTVLGLILLVLPLRLILQIGFTYYRDPLTGWQPPENTAQITAGLNVENKPDIYYIILDGYAGQDILSEYYQFDNTQFINFLKARGFYIPQNSHSNYVHTPLSLASSLNLTYLDFITETSRYSSNRFPLKNLIVHSEVHKLLEQANYSIVGIISSYTWTDFKDADIYLSGKSNQITDFEILLLETSIIQAYVEIKDADLPISGYHTHRSIILEQFDLLAEAVTIDSPKFVFAHILAPHPPFVFDEIGSEVRPERAFFVGDGSFFRGSKDEYRQGYVQQLAYINQLVMQTIDTIMEQSESTPVIILQADHGPGMFLDLESVEKTCIQERTSILNAYYFPYTEETGLYDTITPINTFRLLFDTYFNSKFGTVEDRTFYGSWSHPYDFIDVTQQVDDTCMLTK